MTKDSNNPVLALIVEQWLKEWNTVKYSKNDFRNKPEPHFYMFSLPAGTLRKLSKIYRRKAQGPRVRDTAVQRAHNKDRSEEIHRFVQGGFPWSSLSERQRKQAEYNDLRMPGWLPTAIIANILPPGAQRRGKSIAEDDVIKITQENQTTAYLTLPGKINDKDWEPDVPPIEIIDGQHRLWAFQGDEDLAGAYNLPVVAFYDLDVTWQAYLFYTINIKPKRINTSLAYDLYPLLRTQDWLEKSPDGPKIYRETRAQELTEILWAHKESPWKGRINMLGEKRVPGSVTQAAFIRALEASYIKRSRGIIGGLFGDDLLNTETKEVLGWNRIQQAAFLMFVWQIVELAIKNCKAPWAEKLREHPIQTEISLEDKRFYDSALTSKYSLLTTDQGVRGILNITNDMCYVASKELDLSDWQWEYDIGESIELSDVSNALQELNTMPVKNFLEEVALEIVSFDWRTSSEPSLNESEMQAQMVFRGSGGYKELRRQLLKLLIESKNEQLSNNAEKVFKALGYS